MFANKCKGIHNHIDSLGINDNGDIIDTENAFVGLEASRKAAATIVNLVRSQKYSGKCFLFVGPSGSGKSALARAINEELGPKIPFTIINGNELTSKEVNLSDVLEENLRRSILVRIKEDKNIYEGEVANITDEYVDLRSGKGSKTLKLSKDILEQLKAENIRIGDVVHIDSTSGIIRNMGKGESHMNDYDLEAERYVPLPKGEIFKKREFIHETTLHELDISNIRPTSQDATSLIHQFSNTKRTSATELIRKSVNNLVNSKEYMDVTFGILFIDNAHLMNDECFEYLHKALDSEISPTLILSSCVLKKEEDKVFGLPKHLLTKLLVIPLHENTQNSVKEIIRRRAEVSDIQLTDDGLNQLLEMARTYGLKKVVSFIPILKVFNHAIGDKEISRVVSFFDN